MTYGYFNGYITNIGEDVSTKVDELRPFAEVILVESLSSRLSLYEILDNLQPGDIVYVYSFLRFSSGLKDLVTLMETIIDEKRAHLVSLHDDFDSRTDEGKIARKTYINAVPLITADPSYGFFK
ncbi:MAG: recombinase family protein [Lachnospiraceae bacterium]|nr:recombinase family protein [Lachnospiraceae bacterium]